MIGCFRNCDVWLSDAWEKISKCNSLFENEQRESRKWRKNKIGFLCTLTLICEVIYSRFLSFLQFSSSSLSFLLSRWVSVAVGRRCSLKSVFLKISQNSQENTCVRVSFLIKLQATICNFIKKETVAQVFS